MATDREDLDPRDPEDTARLRTAEETRRRLDRGEIIPGLPFDDGNSPASDADAPAPPG